MSWLLPKNRGARMIDNVNQRIAALQPYKPGKPIEELARELGINDIVKLASNENPLGPSQAVLDAVVEASAQLPRYPDGSGFELKQSLAEHLRVDTAQITLGNGSNDVLDLIARVALQPGSEAIIAEHSFVVYRLAVTCCGGDLVTVPAKDKISSYAQRPSIGSRSARNRTHSPAQQSERPPSRPDTARQR